MLLESISRASCELCHASTLLGRLTARQGNCASEPGVLRNRFGQPRCLQGIPPRSAMSFSKTMGRDAVLGSIGTMCRYVRRQQSARARAGDFDYWPVFKNGIPPIPDGPVLLRPLGAVTCLSAQRT